MKKDEKKTKAQLIDELAELRGRITELVKERTTKLMTVNEQLRQEITERKRVEEALRESEGQYRTFFESLQDVFYRTDTEGNIMLVSPCNSL